jgi:hypothetical protein
MMSASSTAGCLLMSVPMCAGEKANRALLSFSWKYTSSRSSRSGRTPSCWLAGLSHGHHQRVGLGLLLGQQFYVHAFFMQRLQQAVTGYGGPSAPVKGIN